MRWLVDGYNVIRRAPELRSREQESLEAGRQALCAMLATVARVSRDTFTVVFDGVDAGGRGGGGAGVTVIFSSARESADHVLARMARQGGAVVSNDREVRRAAQAQIHDAVRLRTRGISDEGCKESGGDDADGVAFH